MFAVIKSFFERSRSKSNCENIVRVNLNGQEFVALMSRCAIATYGGAGHIFMRRYLMPYINPNNSQLKKEMEIRLSSINQKRFPLNQLPKAIESQMTDRDSFIWVIMQLWYPYMLAEMQNQEDPITFLRIQVNSLIELLLKILMEIYDRNQSPNPQKETMLYTPKFHLELIEMVTDRYEFQKIKSLFIKECKQGRGVNGQFTPSQIQMTAAELNQLMKFREIPAPFHQSIGLMLDFYREYRLGKKVKLLVQAVDKAKQEILQYRNFFQMGKTTIGSDQVMPVINFVCERARKNIFASTQYIRALLGGGEKKFSNEKCKQYLKILANSADYCVELVESMSSINCHTSTIAF